MVNNPDTIFVLLLLFSFFFCERHNSDIGRAPSQAMTETMAMREKGCLVSCCQSIRTTDDERTRFDLKCILKK